jgi:hypothetical protein
MISWPGNPFHVKAGNSLKIRKLDSPAFTQVIGSTVFSFSAKSFCRLHNILVLILLQELAQLFYDGPVTLCPTR